jgi:hypothetical protein
MQAFPVRFPVKVTETMCSVSVSVRDSHRDNKVIGTASRTILDEVWTVTVKGRPRLTSFALSQDAAVTTIISGSR